MKILYLSLLVLFASLFVKAQTAPGSKFTTDSTLTSLKSKRTAIDTYVKKHGKELLLYSKISGKNTPVRVRNGIWPDDGEYSYNVLKDSLGRIVLISEIPFSQSGDWYITYTHYFDGNGNTYAFKKETNAFDSDVKGGVIYETLIKYYGVNLELLDKTYSLKDKSGKPIKNNGHIDVYQYKYTIYKSSAECLKGYRIKLQ